MVDHYCGFTMLVFIGTDSLGDFLKKDIPKLVNAVRNWVGVYVASFELSTYISNQHNSDSRPCTSSNETPCLRLARALNIMIRRTHSYQIVSVLMPGVHILCYLIHTSSD
jgi:hypothetical protein